MIELNMSLAGLTLDEIGYVAGVTIVLWSLMIASAAFLDDYLNEMPLPLPDGLAVVPAGWDVVDTSVGDDSYGDYTEPLWVSQMDYDISE